MENTINVSPAPNFDTQPAVQQQTSTPPAGVSAAMLVEPAPIEDHAALTAYADQLVADGVITREAADKHLALRLGTAQAEPDQAGQGVAPEEQRQEIVVDQTAPDFGAMPSSPDGYIFEPPPDGKVDLGLEQSMRKLFFETKAPQGVAAHVVNRWNQAAANPPTPEQIALEQAATTAHLKATWGADYENNLKMACLEFDDVAGHHPHARKMLDISGMGNDAWLIQTLYNRACARNSAKT